MLFRIMTPEPETLTIIDNQCTMLDNRVHIPIIHNGERKVWDVSISFFSNYLRDKLKNITKPCTIRVFWDKSIPRIRIEESG